MMQELRDTARRVAMSIARAVITMTSDTGGRQQQQLEILDGELRDQVELFTHYGIYSRAHPGADAILVCIGGVREQAVILGTADRRYHFILQEGEVAIADDLGNYVRLGRVSLDVKAVSVLNIEAPQINIKGPVNIQGNITTTGTIINNGHAVDSTHKHTGVTPGSGQTGAPV